jgi:pimeloyl-ACP methyl ester carboxylesterase
MMPKMLANGISFHYQQIGEGPDVVMIHGLTGNLAIWHLEIIPALMDRYRFTTYDLRGHGYSDMPPTEYRTVDHAGDLSNLLDKLGIESAYIVGHSFGADIALHFTILYPQRVRRLILIEPGIQALADLRETRDWVGWEYWRQKLSTGGVTVPPDKWYDAEYLVRQSIRIPKIFGFRKGMQRRSAPLIKLMDTTTAARDYVDESGMTLEKIAEVQKHTLVVYGEDSVFLGTYDYLKANLRNCTPLLIPESEHYGPLEQPAALIEAVSEFLPREYVP